MKGLGVYYHCAKAVFVTLLGPRAMGPSPPEAQGLFCTIYYTGVVEGQKNSPINEKNDKSNDNNEVWDGLYPKHT